MRQRPVLLTVLVATLVLTAVASLRSAEYDEQYTLFLTAGVARPIWPQGIITAGTVQALQQGHAGPMAVARDLRRTDVHPPLYFWLVSGWRGLGADSLFAVRLFSVLCGVATLGLVGWIARRIGIPAVPAMLLTLGCYGFAYTGSIARGFALAELLDVAGVAALLVGSRWRTAAAAGILLGAASFTNYLATFVAMAALPWLAWRQASRVLPALLAFVLWLPGDLWFFLAQRQSRPGQFPPFDPLATLERLARYAAASVFGGLPRYLPAVPASVAGGLLGLLLVVLVGLIVVRWCRIGTPDARALLAAAAAAPPLGLFLLGALFNSSPIELRYLAFAAPFLALLLAGALPVAVRCAVHALQALAVLGLMIQPETMQPARATAAAAASLVSDGVVLLPRGNDGVGIVGAFAREAPPGLPLLVVGPDETPEQIRARVGGYHRVVLALVAQDADSRATLAQLRLAFTVPGWRPTGQGFNALAYQRVCPGQ